MPIRLTDKIVSPSRGSVDEAMAYAIRKGAKRQAFLSDYFLELWRLCAVSGFDFSILVAQSDNETDSWRSPVWQQYGNPAGLAVTNSQNISVVYQSGTDAARAHVVHMWAYRYGRVPKGSELAGYTALDGHYDAVFTTNDTRGNPLAASVKTIDDFNVNGRWCLLDRQNTPTGPLDDYGNRIVRNGQMVWPNLPDQDPPVTTPATPEVPVEETPVALTFGRVPHPPYQQRIITNSTAWNDLGKRTIRAVVWHRMYGTLWGTDGYFRGEASGKALTDYGVGVEATDGVSQAGVILQWNDPTGRRSPWASGPVSNPIDDGAKFVALYGTNGVNRDAVSIEISGTSGNTTFDSRARGAVVALTAYYADQYKVPWDQFPAVPGENRSFVMWHGEIYDGKRNSCPGVAVQAQTDSMIADVKVLLKHYQTTDTTEPEPEPVYAKPQPPAAGNSVVNDRIFLAHDVEYTTKKDVTPRVYADPGSDPTGPVIKKGTRVKTSHVVSDVGESADLTAVLVDGSRIPVREVLV